MFKEISPIKVITPKIPDKSITTAKLADKAVTTAKLADGAVTSEKLGVGLYRHHINIDDYLDGYQVDVDFDYYSSREDPYEAASDFPTMSALLTSGNLVINGQMNGDRVPHHIQIFSNQVRVNYLIYNNSKWSWDYITLGSKLTIDDIVTRLL